MSEERPLNAEEKQRYYGPILKMLTSWQQELDTLVEGLLKEHTKAACPDCGSPFDSFVHYGMCVEKRQGEPEMQGEPVDVCPKCGVMGGCYTTAKHLEHCGAE